MRWALLLISAAIACRQPSISREPRERLEIVLVDDAIDPLEKVDPSLLPEQATIASESFPKAMHYARMPVGGDAKRARALLDKALSTVTLPPDHRFAFGVVDDVPSYVRSYLVTGAPVIRETDVDTAKASFENEQWFVSVTLRPEASRSFEQFTSTHVKARMALILGGDVNSAPIIRSAIPGGKLSITLGSFRGQPDAIELARKLGGPR
jgi:hypothetical protein